MKDHSPVNKMASNMIQCVLLSFAAKPDSPTSSMLYIYINHLCLLTKFP